MKLSDLETRLIEIEKKVNVKNNSFIEVDIIDSGDAEFLYSSSKIIFPFNKPSYEIVYEQLKAIPRNKTI
jgi:hypothetical protein